MNGASIKCLCLEIQCFTVEGFISLLKDCTSGALTKQLQPVQDDLRKLTGNGLLEMEVFMYEDDALTTLEHIGNSFSAIPISSAFLNIKKTF